MHRCNNNKSSDDGYSTSNLKKKVTNDGGETLLLFGLFINGYLFFVCFPFYKVLFNPFSHPPYAEKQPPSKGETSSILI